MEDCTKYFNQEYTTFSPDFTLPSTFKIEYEDYINSSKPSFVYVGETTGKALLCGKIVSSSTQLYIIARNGDSNKVTNCSNCTYNTWISETITYDGTNFEFDNTSVTDLNGVSLTKLVSYDGGGYSKIRNIKIKPL